jgi:hypothetical protein
MPIGGTPQYLAEYNSFQLPGYVQEEVFESVANTAQHEATYADGSQSEYIGLANKILSLTLKVWECDYPTVKTEVQKAATILRTKRKAFAPLKVMWTDRYYDALVTRIGMNKQAGTSVRTGDYVVQFECKPWLVSYSGYTLTGTGSIDTDTVGRTIDDGGWTPTLITVTGTEVTISGYTATGDFAGFVSISGAVTNMVIDSDNFTATIGGINANDRMRWVDYRTYVGPGKTIFETTGASSMTVQYNNRWYL